MERLLVPLVESDDHRRYFHATYIRTTKAFKKALDDGIFLDSDWVERWDVAFANLYLEPLEAWDRGEQPSRPWRIAFEPPATRLPPLRHVLLGMNAHINYDLPPALLDVITDEEFQDESVLERRQTDHRHADEILVARVAVEDKELAAVEQPGDRTLLDRMLTPFNRSGTKKFVREAREKVWRNARLLSRARRAGPDTYRAKMAELEELSAARVADLRRPGQVLLRLAIKGFGVTLSD
jgi:hypothetical protein